MTTNPCEFRTHKPKTRASKFCYANGTPLACKLASSSWIFKIHFENTVAAAACFIDVQIGHIDLGIEEQARGSRKTSEDGMMLMGSFFATGAKVHRSLRCFLEASGQAAHPRYVLFCQPRNRIENPWLIVLLRLGRYRQDWPCQGAAPPEH